MRFFPFAILPSTSLSPLASLFIYWRHEWDVLLAWWGISPLLAIYLSHQRNLFRYVLIVYTLPIGLHLLFVPPRMKLSVLLLWIVFPKTDEINIFICGMPWDSWCWSIPCCQTIVIAADVLFFLAYATLLLL